MGTLILVFMVGLGVFLACKEDVDAENAFAGGFMGCVAAIPVLIVADLVSRTV